MRVTLCIAASWWLSGTAVAQPLASQAAEDLRTLEATTEVAELAGEMEAARAVADIIRPNAIDLEEIPEAKVTLALVGALDLAELADVTVTTTMVGGDPAEDGPARRPSIRIPNAASAYLIQRRKSALQSIVRLTATANSKTTTCSGTLLNWKQGVSVLLAAHCLYPMSPSGVLGYPRRTTLYAHSVGALSLRDALVPVGFDGCAKRGSSYDECARTEPDVALIPVTLPVSLLDPWSACGASSGSNVTAFGFGTDSRGKNGRLLMGAFAVRQAPGERQWLATPEAKPQQVWNGDSGGPVVSATDDASLGYGALLSHASPRVCFVIASRGSQTRSYFEPVWDLDAVFARANPLDPRSSSTENGHGETGDSD
jgi:hypothetical protein